MRSTATSVKQQINDHILDYFTEDMGWPTDDRLRNLKTQVWVFEGYASLPTDYKKGYYMAEGGTFLVYTADMADFLNSLGINPDGKEYPDHKVFEQYCHLIGRQIAELVKG